jgi:hypothetical protein
MTSIPNDNPNDTQGGTDSQAGTSNTQDDSRQALPMPTRRKTHVGTLIQIFKNLPLQMKLKKNKEIEEMNNARLEKKMLHASDPTNYPDDGSSLASFVTVDSEEINSLTVPSTFAVVREVIPFYMHRLLQSRDKRKTHQASDSGTTRVSKRRRKNGDTMIDPEQLGFVYTFPEIYFDTADANAVIPLPFFLPKNMQYVHDNFATLQLRKTNGPDGSKGVRILDLDSLSKVFGAEGTLNYGEFCIAGDQMVRFESMRDEVLNGSYSHGWFSHFSFFKRPECCDYYELWKEGEIDLRRDRITQNVGFNISRYDQLLAQAKFSTRLGLTAKTPQGKSSQPKTTPSSSKKSFQGSSGKRSAPAICILCAEIGHTAFDHPNPDKSAKFPDGKPAWAKLTSGKLTNPEGHELCIKFNTHGKDKCAGLCTHGGDRIHACSFCGAKNHHAFGWSCRSKSSD